MIRKLCLAFCLFVLLVAGSALAQDGGLPGLADLESGWNTLSPGGDTMCAYGTEYTFHIRPAESDHLLIYFNGGGACWFGQICDLGSTTFVPVADIDHNDPRTQVGIFDLENPENPFADYNMVYVPYCTGDVHLGDASTVYHIPATADNPEHDVEFHHNGYNNAMSVLNWVFENYESPDTIFVTGSSAGAIASPFYAGLVAENYPDARIVQLGDAAGGYRAPDSIGLVNEAWGSFNILPDWEEYADYSPSTLNFEAYYVATGTRFPDMVMSQYNTANDQTQLGFLSILGITDVALQGLIDANLADIQASVENFYTYMAGGPVHTMLRSPELYAYEVEGVRLVDWVAALAAGDMVENVTCTDCENPPATSE